MVPNNHSILLFKVGEFRWMDRIKNGHLSLGTLGSFIQIAKLKGNEEQGDPDEGVFARLPLEDPRINQMKTKLENDLEIIEDGQFVKLRRKSSYFIPTFCFYSYRGIDLVENSNKTAGQQQVSHYFDDRIFSGFADDSVRNTLASDRSYSMLILQAEPFKNKVYCAFARNEIENGYIRHVDYTEFAKEVFFIEPTEAREELFHKFPKYAYQHEARICLMNNLLPSIYDRYSLDIGPWIEGRDGAFIRNQVYFETSADIVKQ